MACVLIVEDEDQVHVLADSYLQQQGHKTFSASTIDGALALLDGDQDVCFGPIVLQKVAKR